MAIVKMRRSAHTTQIHAIEITSRGLVIKEALTSYRGILTAEPTLREVALRPRTPG